mgnify:CR=1 FL=1
MPPGLGLPLEDGSRAPSSEAPGSTVSPSPMTDSAVTDAPPPIVTRTPTIESRTTARGLMRLSLACKALEIDTKGAASSAETAALVASVLEQFDQAQCPGVHDVGAAGLLPEHRPIVGDVGDVARLDVAKALREGA